MRFLNKAATGDVANSSRYAIDGLHKPIPVRPRASRTIFLIGMVVWFAVTALILQSPAMLPILALLPVLSIGSAIWSSRNREWIRNTYRQLRREELERQDDETLDLHRLLYGDHETVDISSDEAITKLIEAEVQGLTTKPRISATTPIAFIVGITATIIHILQAYSWQSPQLSPTPLLVLGVSAAAIAFVNVWFFGAITRFVTQPRFGGDDRAIKVPRKDQDDIRIIEIETDVTALQKRVDAYIFDGSILAGLALASFFTIMTSDIFGNIQPVIEDIRRYFSDGNPLANTEKLFQLPHLLWALLLGDADAPIINTITPSISDDISVELLVVPLSILLIVISGLFLSVLMLRIPFTHQFGKALLHVNLARHFNQNEERAWSAWRKKGETRGGEANAETSSWSRLNQMLFTIYYEKVDELLLKAENARSMLKFYVGCMLILRVIGFAVVILTLAGCGIYFGNSITTALILLLVAAFAIGAVLQAIQRVADVGEHIDERMASWFERVLKRGQNDRPQ